MWLAPPNALHFEAGVVIAKPSKLRYNHTKAWVNQYIIRQKSIRLRSPAVPNERQATFTSDVMAVSLIPRLSVVS